MQEEAGEEEEEEDQPIGSGNTAKENLVAGLLIHAISSPAGVQKEYHFMQLQ